MKILIISQYFWPENFRVNDLSLELKNRGHDVTVLTGKPNYPKGNFFKGYNFINKRNEIWNEIQIKRVSLIPRGGGSSIRLLFNYFSFLIFASLRIFFLNEKFDKIIVYQLSPATVGFPGIIAKNKYKAQLFFYIQDLWPESLKDAGGLNSKLILYLVDSMMTFFYKSSTQIWVQSLKFENYLIYKGVEKNKIKYLPNTVEEFYKPQPILDKYSSKIPVGFNILFAGNIGVAQDFDTIINCAKILREKKLKINWLIFGTGREKDNIEKLISKLKLENIFYFFGQVPSEEMPFYFTCADLLLVSLKKSSIFSLTIPSKIQSYLACKKPIIGNIEGIGAEIISDSNSGHFAPSGDFIELSNKIEILYKKTESELNNYGVNGYNYFLQNFERNKIYNKMEEYLLN